MKVVILGSGVVGVTTAWYLAQDGHEVEVIDRQPESALETSYGNAGEISPGYATPWAAPGIPFKAFKWMFERHAPLVLHPRVDPTMWRWLFQMLSNCTAPRYAVNKARMVRIAEYARDMLKQMRADIGIEYDERALGTLEVFRTEKALAGIAKDLPVLDQHGVKYEVLDVDGCIAVEPALARVREKIRGGLRLPGDETGDCFKFTQELTRRCKAAGVVFRNNVTIKAITQDGSRITGLDTSEGTVTGDTYVVALGSYSPFFLKPLGINIPVYPMKGYSLTLPITDPAGAPESTIMDEAHKVAITRLGDRIRVAGMAELAGFDLTLHKKHCDTIAYVVNDLFPDGGSIDQAEYWCGLRPNTPDSVPVLGQTPYSNLILNTGHGTLGWTMSCGTARVTADLVSGKTPAIDMEGLSMDRYGRSARTAVSGMTGPSLTSPAFNCKA